MTNGDRIRNMGDLDLRFIIRCPYEYDKTKLCKTLHCEECVLEWLKSEVEDD